MKIKFTKECQDKNTSERYSVGQEKEFEDERALEIIEKGFAVEVEPNEPTEPNEPQEQAQEITYDDQFVPVKLDELSVEELRKCAKDLGVAVRGSKAEIIARIEAKREELGN